MAQPVPARPIKPTINPNYRNEFGTNMADGLVCLYLQNMGGSQDVNIVNNAFVVGSTGQYSPNFDITTNCVNYRNVTGTGLSSYMAGADDGPNAPGWANDFTVIVKIKFNAFQGNCGGVFDYNYPAMRAGCESSGDLRWVIARQTVNMYIYLPVGAITAGQWVQLGFVYSYGVANGSVIGIYVDGTYYGQGTAGVSYNQGTGNFYGTGGYGSGGNALGIGRQTGSPAGLNGQIAYFAMYSGRALNGADITSLDNGLPITGGTTLSVNALGTGALPGVKYQRIFDGGGLIPVLDYNVVRAGWRDINPCYGVAENGAQRLFDAPTTNTGGGTGGSANSTGVGQIFPTGNWGNTG